MQLTTKKKLKVKKNEIYKPNWIALYVELFAPYDKLWEVFCGEIVWLWVQPGHI